MARIGVIICHCGTNIAATVDVAALAEAARTWPGVVFAATHQHACSAPGQAMIKAAIAEYQLDRLVIGSCSPRLHEQTFRKMLADTPINPYLLEVANLREQCAWVHQEWAQATAKAADLLRMAVAKVRRAVPLFSSAMPLTKRCLVIGGGIAGVQAALDIAELGYPVTVVEREPALGGKMALLDKTFPTMDCAACICEPKLAEAAHHDNITLRTNSEVTAVSGCIGNFAVTIKSKARVDNGDACVTEQYGAIVMAAGYQTMDWARHYPQYGGGRLADVISGLQFEQLLNASGLSQGQILRPSDGKPPQTVAIIKCVGSRDAARGHAYCSRVCCMAAAKHARQVLAKIPGSACYVFYLDVRAAGKGYEEFYEAARADGAVYVRGRVAKIYRENGKLMLLAEDTLLGRQLRLAADLVVLETALEAPAGLRELAGLAGVTTDAEGWLNEAHPKLKPVETLTGGVFLCGACQGPKDIADTVAQASAAAAKVGALLAKDSLITNPIIAAIAREKCSGCGACVGICPYQAISVKEIPASYEGREVVKRAAEINPALCRGCGACAAACRNGALDLCGFSNRQILEEVDALCRI